MVRRFPHPYTLRDAEEWIAIAMAAPRGQILTIEVDGTIAGGIAIEPHEGERTGTALFGYRLGHNGPSPGRRAFHRRWSRN
jgi:hypothetical protein